MLEGGGWREGKNSVKDVKPGDAAFFMLNTEYLRPQRVLLNNSMLEERRHNILYNVPNNNFVR